MRLPLLAGIFFALLSALLFSLAFPPNNIGWLAWIAWIPVIIAQFGLGLSDRAGRALQALAYAGFLEIAFAQAFPVDLLPGFVPIAAITPGAFLLALFIYFTGLPGGTLAFHRRTGYRWFLVLPPLGWIGLEFARYVLELGQLWGTLPVTQWDNLPLLQMATLGGMWLVGGLVVLANYALGLALLMALRHAPRRPLWPAAGLAMVLIAHLLGALMLGESTHTVRVAALQAGGDIEDQVQLWQVWGTRDWPGLSNAVLDVLEPPTREAASRGARWIVWSEASLWVDPQRDDAIRTRLVRLAQETKAYLVVPYFLWPDDLTLSWFLEWRPGQRNEVVVVAPDGAFLGVAAKDHPIGYIGETGATRGAVYPVYDTPVGRLATMIGYDNAFTDSARRYAGLGAQMLTLSMHDWVANSDIYSKYAVVRAVENRVGIIRSDWRSGTLIADPYGRILATTPKDRLNEAIVIADLPLAEPAGTLYTRTGDWLGALALIVTLVWVFRMRQGGQRTA